MKTQKADGLRSNVQDVAQVAHALLSMRHQPPTALKPSSQDVLLIHQAKNGRLSHQGRTLDVFYRLCLQAPLHVRVMDPRHRAKPIPSQWATERWSLQLLCHFGHNKHRFHLAKLIPLILNLLLHEASRILGEEETTLG